MAGVISVRLPDGSQRELAEGTTAAEFAQSIGPRLAKAAVIATVDGHQVDAREQTADELRRTTNSVNPTRNPTIRFR
jgi:TGS domain